MIPKFEDLKQMKLDELIKEHDRHIDLMNSTGHQRQATYAEYYRQEILRREQDIQTKKMIYYTWWIVLMTIIITIATIANLYLVYESIRISRSQMESR
jgi:hypothetical protein